MRNTLALALVLLVSLGCAGGLRKTVRAPEKPLALTTVFVYPIRFMGSTEPGWRSFELSERMMAAAVREGSEVLAFYAPAEFKVLSSSENAWVGSTALPLLTRSGSRPDQGLVIRPSVERRVMSAVQERENAKGRGASASNQLTTYVVRLELVHPSSKAVLAEFEGDVTVDPFAEASPEQEYDPGPQLTALLERMTAELVTLAKDLAAPRATPPRDVSLRLAVSPKTALTQTDPAAGSEPLQLDALQTELLLENIARVLSPGLSGKALQHVVSSRAGVVVVEAPDGGKLQVGDLIETVDGSPALPNMVFRGRLRPVPLELRVVRSDGTQREIVFP